MGKKEDRRESVLHSAKKVFSEKGYHGASVSDIVEHAGIARGTFYLYFENKRQVFDSILDMHLEELQGLIRPIRLDPGAPSPLEQLRNILRSVIELALEDRERTRILLDRAVGLDEDSDKRLSAFYDVLLSRIEAALRQGMELGIVRECNPQVAARCALGSIKEIIGLISSDDSLSARGSSSPDGDTSEEKAAGHIEAILDEVLRYGFQGLLTPQTVTLFQ